MTKETSSGTDAGSGTASAGINAAAVEPVDTLDQDLEAMRLSELDDTPGPEDVSRSAPAKAEPVTEPADDGAGGQEPLSVEEVNQRWKDQKAATRQEREARRAGEARIADLERRIAELSNGGQPQQQQPPNPLEMDIPDPDQDPAGAFRAVIQLARAMREERVETERATETATTQSTALREVLGDFRSAETEYMKVEPTYNDAVQHLRAGMIEEFKLLGANEQQANQLFQREVLNKVVAAMQTDQHPAHVLFNLARARGFTGPKPAVPEPEQARQDMQVRAAAQKLAKTMSGAGGKPASNTPTYESVNAIEDGDEFDRAFNELAKASGMRF